MGNWEGEKYKALPPERKEEIIRLVELGREKVAVRFEEKKRVRDALKAGRQFLATNEIPVISMSVGGYKILAAMQPVDGVNSSDGYVRLEYVICSPRDQFSGKVGRGKLGSKLSRGRGRVIKGIEGSDVSTRLQILSVIEREGGSPRKMFKNFLV